MASISPYATSAGRRYRVRYRTPDRRQTDKRGFTTTRDAELFLASVEVSKDRGDFVSANLAQVTLAEWATVWLSAQVQLKPSTAQGYAAIVNSKLIPKWGSVPLGRLTHSGIQGWISEETKRVKPATVRSYHRVLSMILKFAVRDGRLSRNPADGIQLPRSTSSKHGYLTHAQLHELAALSAPESTVVLFLGYTGLRWGEMAALRVGDIDVARRRVNVERAVVELATGELVYGSPKNHQRRSVPFPTFLTQRLENAMVGKKSGDLVFTAPSGLPLRSNNWKRRAFDRAMGEMLAIHPDLIRLTVHDLRHTAPSLAISAGANVKAVQRMLGHASAAMTLDVYSELFDDDLDAVGAALSVAGDPAVVGKLWAKPEKPEPEKATEGLEAQ